MKNKMKLIVGAMLIANLSFATETDVNYATITGATSKNVAQENFPITNVYDGVISDNSRWIAALNDKKISELIVTFEVAENIKGLEVYTGFRKGAYEYNFDVYYLDAENKWQLLTKVQKNKTAATVKMLENSVSTSSLKFIFIKSYKGTTRVKEIKVIKTDNIQK